ncbi:MAG TPA: NAD(P)-dependent oxidoreductase [Microthrixaceae bacterium]|mgnify:CR=1 FL=1|nr:NAD(P)-dependent oxidoreductase [Microthrixaceae bacterium]
MAVAGFVGLGNIGAPMAKRLLSNPDGLAVFDLSAEATAPFAEAGATVADPLAALGEAAEVICICVRDDAQVREVVGGLLEVARPGQAYVIHSTIRATTAEDLAEIAAAKGVYVVDAPISGGAMGAGDGRLAIMVGGTDEALEVARPVLELMGSMISHLGPVGAGTRTKLARNMMHFVSYASALEASRLAEAAGIDIEELGRIVRHSDQVTGGPGAIQVRNTTAQIDPDDWWYGVMENVLSLGGKDLSQAIELADELGVDVPIARLGLDQLAFALGVASSPLNTGRNQ